MRYGEICIAGINRRNKGDKTMYVNATTKERVTHPELGERYYMENPCDGKGGHEYADRVCACGRDFCWSCCGGTNIHEGGKYTPDFMLCPACGRDWYSEV